MVKIGILATGAPPAELASRFGSYVQMFQRFLGPDFEYLSFDVQSGQYPVSTCACDAYLVTGSACGVYDGHAWIAALRGFLREASVASALAGFCFGHQVIAEAFGGRVQPASAGWGIGLHKYEVRHQAAWMDTVAEFCIAASHRDQVVQPPADAIVLAASAHTPYAALLYPQRRTVTFQCHPEFTPQYAAALIDFRRGSIYGQVQADAAVASLRMPNDNERLATWLRRFFRIVVSSSH